VVSLGLLMEPTASFHDAAFIFPPGFSSRRVFADVWRGGGSGAKALYKCDIQFRDGGAADALVFQITRLSGDCRGDGGGGGGTPGVWMGSTADAACGALFRDAFDAGRSVEARGLGPPSGPAFFGFGVPVVQRAIEGMHLADTCTAYFFLAQRARGALLPALPGAVAGAARAALPDAGEARAALPDAAEGRAKRPRADNR